MMSAMTAIEWLKWKAFMALSPSNEEQENWRTALIAASIWNVQLAKAATKRNPAEFKPLSEFWLPIVGDVPDPRIPVKRQTEKDKWAAIKEWASSFKRKGT